MPFLAEHTPAIQIHAETANFAEDPAVASRHLRLKKCSFCKLNDYQIFEVLVFGTCV